MEKKIRKILCPIDFSDVAVNAMDYAAQLSKLLDASLTLWNLREISIMDEISNPSNLALTLNKKKKQLTEILDDWCEEVNAEYGIDCDYSIGTGVHNLESTLSHYVEGEKFDLIVTGTNGVDDMYQFFFGSNSYRIMKKVNCPVMIIPEGLRFEKINSILFATNYALEDAIIAKDLMSIFDANISFAHISDNENLISREVYRSFKNLVGEKMEEDTREVKFKRRVDKERLDALLNLINEEKAQLLVLSIEQRSWMEDLFHKSLSRKLLDGLQSPTLIIHQGGQHEEYKISLEKEDLL